jgi:hypothetical protein
MIYTPTVHYTLFSTIIFAIYIRGFIILCLSPFVEIVDSSASLTASPSPRVGRVVWTVGVVGGKVFKD